jgi:TP901 family phage tail tape measure protein
LAQLEVARSVFGKLTSEMKTDLDALSKRSAELLKAISQAKNTLAKKDPTGEMSKSMQRQSEKFKEQQSQLKLILRSLDSYAKKMERIATAAGNASAVFKTNKKVAGAMGRPEVQARFTATDPNLVLKLKDAFEAFNRALLAVIDTRKISVQTSIEHTKALKEELTALNVLTGRAKVVANAINNKNKATRDSAKATQSASVEQRDFANMMGVAIGKIIRYRIAYIALSRTVEAFKESANLFIKFEYELGQIHKVLPDLRADMDALRSSATEFSAKFGVDLLKVVDIMKIWAQQGYEVNDLNQLTEITLRAVVGAGLDTTQAVEMLTATMRQYGLSIEETIGVIDKITYVQAKHAVTTQDLADSIKILGATAAVVGVSIDEFLGHVAAMGEVTRKSGNAVAQSLKTIYARIYRPEAIKQFQNLGIAVRSSLTEIRPVSDILFDLKQQWDGLTQAQKLNIAMAAGGVRRYADFIAMMETYDVALKAASESATSIGYSQRMMSIEMDLLYRKMEQAKASVKAWGQEYGKNSTAKLVEFLVASQRAADNMGLLSKGAAKGAASFSVFAVKVAAGFGAMAAMRVGIRELNKLMIRSVASTGVWNFGLGSLAKAYINVGKNAKDMARSARIAELDIRVLNVGMSRAEIAALKFGTAIRIASINVLAFVSRVVIAAGALVALAAKFAVWTLVATGVSYVLEKIIKKFTKAKVEIKEFDDSVFDTIVTTKDAIDAYDKQASRGQMLSNQIKKMADLYDGVNAGSNEHKYILIEMIGTIQKLNSVLGTNIEFNGDTKKLLDDLNNAEKKRIDYLNDRVEKEEKLLLIQIKNQRASLSGKITSYRKAGQALDELYNKARLFEVNDTNILSKLRGELKDPDKLGRDLSQQLNEVFKGTDIKFEFEPFAFGYDEFKNTIAAAEKDLIDYGIVSEETMHRIDKAWEDYYTNVLQYASDVDAEAIMVAQERMDRLAESIDKIGEKRATQFLGMSEDEFQAFTDKYVEAGAKIVESARIQIREADKLRASYESFGLGYDKVGRSIETYESAVEALISKQIQLRAAEYASNKSAGIYMETMAKLNNRMGDAASRAELWEEVLERIDHAFGTAVGAGPGGTRFGTSFGLPEGGYVEADGRSQLEVLQKLEEEKTKVSGEANKKRIQEEIDRFRTFISEAHAYLSFYNNVVSRALNDPKMAAELNLDKIIPRIEAIKKSYSELGFTESDRTMKEINLLQEMFFTLKVLKPLYEANVNKQRETAATLREQSYLFDEERAKMEGINKLASHYGGSLIGTYRERLNAIDQTLAKEIEETNLKEDLTDSQKTYNNMISTSNALHSKSVALLEYEYEVRERNLAKIEKLLNNINSAELSSIKMRGNMQKAFAITESQRAKQKINEINEEIRLNDYLTNLKARVIKSAGFDPDVEAELLKDLYKESYYTFADYERKKAEVANEAAAAYVSAWLKAAESVTSAITSIFVNLPRNRSRIYESIYDMEDKIFEKRRDIFDLEKRLTEQEEKYANAKDKTASGIAIENINMQLDVERQRLERLNDEMSDLHDWWRAIYNTVGDVATKIADIYVESIAENLSNEMTQLVSRGANGGMIGKMVEVLGTVDRAHYEALSTLKTEMRNDNFEFLKQKRMWEQEYLNRLQSIYAGAPGGSRSYAASMPGSGVVIGTGVGVRSPGFAKKYNYSSDLPYAPANIANDYKSIISEGAEKIGEQKIDPDKGKWKDVFEYAAQLMAVSIGQSIGGGGPGAGTGAAIGSALGMMSPLGPVGSVLGGGLGGWLGGLFDKSNKKDPLRDPIVDNTDATDKNTDELYKVSTAINDLRSEVINAPSSFILPPAARMPFFANGGYVSRGGVGVLHKGESVVPRGVDIGGIQIHIHGNVTNDVIDHAIKKAKDEFGKVNMSDDRFSNQRRQSSGSRARVL